MTAVVEVQELDLVHGWGEPTVVDLERQPPVAVVFAQGSTAYDPVIYLALADLVSGVEYV